MFESSHPAPTILPLHRPVKLFGPASINRREATNRGVCIGGLITSGAALVICVLWLVGIGIAGSQTAPSRSTIPTVGAAPAAQANPQAAPAKPAGPATSFGDGTYEVGVDVVAGSVTIKAGEFFQTSGGCNWAKQ
jgi:hypothetical protein